MLPPPLPAPLPVAVSAETRLAYVLRHFWLAYPGGPVVAVGYAGTQPQVEIAELSGDFFAGSAPYPAAPNWRAWQGQQIPFFFDQPDQPLLVLQENRAVISADIIAAAFYLLSGWQEYFSGERDRHGRFPYAASVQQQYGFVARPVVNYYFDVLRAAVAHVSGQPLRPRSWGAQKADFAAFISHDVDNLRSAWKAPAKAALQQRKFGRFGWLLWQHLTQPDAWDNLEAVAAAVAQYGGRSTFFILPSHRKAANGTPNADYRLTPKLRQRLAQLAAQGCELGLHGSLGTAINDDQLEADVFEANTAFNVRFHYLSWEPRQTIALLNDAEMKWFAVSYDSTLGFAEHYGFRHSYCQPFYPFNFAAGREANFLEIPLNVMDTTLHHPKYLQRGLGAVAQREFRPGQHPKRPAPVPPNNGALAARRRSLPHRPRHLAGVHCGANS
ncbi:MAG: hypothetical protein EOO36_04505 [Cytophagaceae bacterium]|nr:MAG: hypothetical protein EOO36_04505 [Cytophagaceae bacterium]